MSALRLHRGCSRNLNPAPPTSPASTAWKRMTTAIAWHIAAAHKAFVWVAGRLVVWPPLGLVCKRQTPLKNKLRERINILGKTFAEKLEPFLLGWRHRWPPACWKVKVAFGSCFSRCVCGQSSSRFTQL